MRPARKIILALAFVSFLTITISGFHLHADVGGHDESASHAHDLHQDVAGNLEHEAEHVDISVFEPARGFSKVEMFAPVTTIPESAATRPVETYWSKYAPSVAPQNYSRLRPPLRAPPIFI
jgi:hypothetical protein